jgi:hypothetical protein
VLCFDELGLILITICLSDVQTYIILQPLTSANNPELGLRAEAGMLIVILLSLVTKVGPLRIISFGILALSLFLHSLGHLYPQSAWGTRLVVPKLVSPQYLPLTEQGASLHILISGA